jgi:hypothetical protein
MNKTIRPTAVPKPRRRPTGSAPAVMRWLSGGRPDASRKVTDNLDADVHEPSTRPRDRAQADRRSCRSGICAPSRISTRLTDVLSWLIWR